MIVTVLERRKVLPRAIEGKADRGPAMIRRQGLVMSHS